MPRPKWMDGVTSPTRLRMCRDCRHPGEPCGVTRNTGHGRMTMYRCKLHPTVVLYRETYACEDFERGDNGIDW